MTREENIIRDLYEAKENVLAYGFHQWSYTVLTIENAIKYLTEIK